MKKYLFLLILEFFFINPRNSGESGDVFTLLYKIITHIFE